MLPLNILLPNMLPLTVLQLSMLILSVPLPLKGLLR